MFIGERNLIDAICSCFLFPIDLAIRVLFEVLRVPRTVLGGPAFASPVARPLRALLRLSTEAVSTLRVTCGFTQLARVPILVHIVSIFIVLVYAQKRILYAENIYCQRFVYTCLVILLAVSISVHGSIQCPHRDYYTLCHSGLHIVSIG